MRRWRPGLLVAAVLAVVPTRLAAADSVAIESHVGVRPSDADSLLAPVVAELSAAGFAAPPEIGGELERTISRSGTPLSAERLAEAEKFIDSGYTQFVEGNFELATKDLSRGLEILAEAPATLAISSDKREARMKGLIGLSLAHKRAGDSVEASRAMTELIRSFPDKEISHSEYGPEPRAFFDKVKKDLAGQGLGSLRVTVDGEETVVFVNERYVGVGEVTLDELYPGRYRVFVQQGNRRGRVHDVSVEAGQQARLSITWGLDASLQTEPAALLFSSDSERDEHQGEYAIRLARAAGARSVAILGIQDVGGRRAVVGTLYSVDSSKPVRTGTVAVEPAEPGPDKLRALGKFLAGDEAAKSLLDDLPVADDRGDRGMPADRSRPSRALAWITLVAGLGAVGGGVTLVAIDEPQAEGGVRNPEARNTATAGYVVAGVGAAAVAASVYLFLRDPGEDSSSEIALTPVAGSMNGLAITGTF